MSPSTSVRFGIRKDTKLEWSHLDDESVLFNPLSGRTHLLTILAIDILERLQESPITNEQLVDYLCDLYANSSGVDFQQQIYDSLVHLQSLEIIETVGRP